jgi:hypothetical protein
MALVIHQIEQGYQPCMRVDSPWDSQTAGTPGSDSLITIIGAALIPARTSGSWAVVTQPNCYWLTVLVPVNPAV